MTLCNFVLFALIGWTLAVPFFRFQTDNPQIIAYGRDYVTVCIGCSIGLFFQMYNERLLQSTGRTNLSMITQIAGAATNIVLDPILIFGLLGFPRLEVAGAAIATVIGQLVGASIGFYLNLTRNPDVHLRRREIRPHAATIKEIYAVGVPSIIMQSIGSVMVFGMNKILISFTEAATAVFGAYFKLQSFIFMPIFGLNNAMVPIISYNYGAGKPERFRRTIRLSAVTAIAIMCVGLALFEIIPGTLLGLFSPSEEMLTIGRSRAAHHRPDVPARGLLHRLGQRLSGARHAVLQSDRLGLPPDLRAAAGGVSALPDRTAGAGVVVVPHRRAREPDALGHLPAQDAARGRRTPEPKIKKETPSGGWRLLAVFCAYSPRPGMFRPLVKLFMRLLIASSACRSASLTAEITRSCSISTSSGSTASGLMVSAVISFLPFAAALTAPPPTLAVKVASSTSC